MPPIDFSLVEIGMEDIHHLFLIGEVEAMNFIGSILLNK
jgi:hypothetical protein